MGAGPIRISLMNHTPSATEPGLILDRGRLTIAVSLAPLLAPFYSAILFERPWDIPFGLIASYAGVLALGLPGARWLAAHRHRDFASFSVLGALCSLPGMLLYAWLPRLTHIDEFGADTVAVMLGWGAVTGMGFWLLAAAGDSPLTLRTLFDVGPPDDGDSHR
jgi:hypothetical protein